MGHSIIPVPRISNVSATALLGNRGNSEDYAENIDFTEVADLIGAAHATDLLTKADLVNGLVPTEQLPSYVDDVLEYEITSQFPLEGELNKIYVTTVDNRIYRWSGSIYVAIDGMTIGYVPYTGATQGLNLGAYGITAASVSAPTVQGTTSLTLSGGSGNVSVNGSTGAIVTGGGGITVYTAGGGSTLGAINAASVSNSGAALSLGHVDYGVTFPGQTTNPGAGDQSERFGKQAAAASYGGTAYGAYANAAGYGGTALGAFSYAPHHGTAVGLNSVVTQGSVGIGYNAGSGATGTYFTALGFNTQPGAYFYGILLGADAANTASNQMQIGAATFPITQQRFHTNGASLTLANETGTFATVSNAGAVGVGCAPSAGKLHMKQTIATYLGGLAIEAVANDSFLSIRYDGSDAFVISPTWQSTGAYKALALRTSETNRLLIGVDGTATFSDYIYGTSAQFSALGAFGGYGVGTATLCVQSWNASLPALNVRAAYAQSVNILNVKNSVNTDLVTIGSTGTTTFNVTTQFNGNSRWQSYGQAAQYDTTFDGNNLTVNYATMTLTNNWGSIQLKSTTGLYVLNSLGNTTAQIIGAGSSFFAPMLISSDTAAGLTVKRTSSNPAYVSYFVNTNEEMGRIGYVSDHNGSYPFGVAAVNDNTRVLMSGLGFGIYTGATYSTRVERYLIDQYGNHTITGTVNIVGSSVFSGTITATSAAQNTSGFIAKGSAIDQNWGGGIDFTADNGTVYGSIRSSSVSPGLIQTGTAFTGDVIVGGTTAQSLYINRNAGGGSATWGAYIQYGAATKAGIDANVGTGEVRIGGLAVSYYPVIYSNGTAALTFSTAGVATFSGQIVANGGITSPNASYPNTSEQFGYGAVAGDLGVAIGRNATGWPNGAGVAIGYNSISDYASVSVGYGAVSGWMGVAVGFGSFTLDGYGVGGTAIGKSATVLHDGSIALGNGATSTAVQQFQLGSSGAPIVQQRFHTGGGSLTFANETGTYMTVSNAGAVTFSGAVIFSSTTTMNGNLTVNGTVRATGSGVGSVQLSPGGNPQVGLVEWFQPGGARTAYMGYNGDANLTLGFDQGGAFTVGGAGNFSSNAAAGINIVRTSANPSYASFFTNTSTEVGRVGYTSDHNGTYPFGVVSRDDNTRVLMSGLGFGVFTGSAYGSRVERYSVNQYGDHTFTGPATFSGNVLANESQKIGWRYASGDVGPYQYLMANGAANNAEIGVYNSVGSGAANTVLRIYKYSGGFTAAVDFKNNGNVLIGTTTDDGTSKLQVAGAATFSGNVYGPRFYAGASGVLNDNQFGYDGNGLLIRAGSPGGLSILDSAGKYAFYSDNGGIVKLAGTNTADGAVQVYRNADTQLKCKGQTGFAGGLVLDTTTTPAACLLMMANGGVNKWGMLYYLNPNDLDFYDYTNSRSTLHISADGRVGVMNTAPTVALDVTGTGRVRNTSGDGLLEVATSGSSSYTAGVRLTEHYGGYWDIQNVGGSGSPAYALGFKYGGTQVASLTTAGVLSAASHKVMANTYGWMFQPSLVSTGSVAIYDETNAREPFRINPTGNVILLHNLYVNGGTYGGSEAGIVLQQSGVTKWQLYDVSSTFRIYNATTATNAMIVDAANSNATFAGTVYGGGKILAGTQLGFSGAEASNSAFFPYSTSMYWAHYSTAIFGAQDKFWVNDGIHLGSKTGIQWWNTTGDIQLVRVSAGAFDIRGDSGLRIRNLANSADAALSCAGFTASGDTSLGAAGTRGLLVKNAVSGTTTLEFNPDKVLLTQSIIKIWGYQSTYLDLIQSHTSALGNSLQSPVLRFIGNHNLGGTQYWPTAEIYFTPTNYEHGYLSFGCQGSPALTVYRTENRAPVVGVNTLLTAGQLNVVPSWTGKKGIVVTGVSGQTETLFEAQNDAGTPVASIAASGNMVLGVSFGIQISTVGSAGYYHGTSDGALFFGGGTTSALGSVTTSSFAVYPSSTAHGGYTNKLYAYLATGGSFNVSDGGTNVMSVSRTGNITLLDQATISAGSSSLRIGQSYSQWVAQDSLQFIANGQTITMGGSGVYMHYRSNVVHQFLNSAGTAPQDVYGKSFYAGTANDHQFGYDGNGLLIRAGSPGGLSILDSAGKYAFYSDNGGVVKLAGTNTTDGVVQVYRSADTQLKCKGETGLGGGLVLDTTSTPAACLLLMANAGVNKWGMLYYLNAGDLDFYDYTNSRSTLHISADGRVGVMNTSPTVALDVAGTARVRNTAGSGLLEVATYSSSSYTAGVRLTEHYGGYWDIQNVGGSGSPAYALGFKYGGTQVASLTTAGVLSAASHKVMANTYGWMFQPSLVSTGSVAIYDETNAREPFRINPTGNVILLHNLYVNGGTYGGSEAGIVLQQSGVTKWQLYDVSSTFRIYNATTATNAMIVDAANSNATFAGTVYGGGKILAGTQLGFSGAEASNSAFFPYSTSMYWAHYSTAIFGAQDKFWVNDGIHLGSKTGIQWWNTTGDIQLVRVSAGAFDIRGDSGLRIRNLANSADAALSCAGFTASGDTSLGAAGTRGLLVKNAVSGTTTLEFNPDKVLLTQSIIKIWGYQSTYLDLIQSHTSALGNSLQSPVLRFIGNHNLGGTQYWPTAEIYFTPTNYEHGYLSFGCQGSPALTVYRTENRAPVVGVNTLLTAGQLNVVPSWTGKKGIVVTGVSGQTETLFEAQNDAGTPVASIAASGNMVLGVSFGIQISTVGSAGYYHGTSDGALFFGGGTTSALGSVTTSSFAVYPSSTAHGGYTNKLYAYLATGGSFNVSDGGTNVMSVSRTGNITLLDQATISAGSSSLRIGQSYSQWVAQDSLQFIANGQTITMGGSGVYMHYRSNVVHQFLNSAGTAPQDVYGKSFYAGTANDHQFGYDGNGLLIRAGSPGGLSILDSAGKYAFYSDNGGVVKLAGTNTTDGVVQVYRSADTQLKCKGETGLGGGLVLDTTSTPAACLLLMANAGVNKWGMLYYLNAGDLDFYDYTNSRSTLHISADGRVGVMNTSPTVALDVAGTARVRNTAGSGLLEVATYSSSSYTAGVRLTEHYGGYWDLIGYGGSGGSPSYGFGIKHSTAGSPAFSMTTAGESTFTNTVTVSGAIVATGQYIHDSDVNGWNDAIKLTNGYNAAGAGQRIVFYQYNGSADVKSGFIGSRRWASGANFGELVFGVGTNDSWTEHATLDGNGKFTSSHLHSTGQIAALTSSGHMIGLAGSTLQGSYFQHCLYAVDHLDVYQRVGNGLWHQYIYDGRVGFGLGADARADVVGAVTVKNAVAANPVLVAIGHASQTGALFEARQSGGTVVASITNAGVLTAAEHRLMASTYGWSFRAGGNTGSVAIYDETNAREHLNIHPGGNVKLLNNLIINGGTYGGAEAGIILQQSGVTKWQLYDASSTFRIWNATTAADAMRIAAADSATTFYGIVKTPAGITSQHPSWPNASEQFGYNAVADNQSVAVGTSASCANAAIAVAVGDNASATYAGVAVGKATVAGWYGVAIGRNATTETAGTGVDGPIAIGHSASAGHHGSIALGASAATTALKQFQVGSATSPITQQRFHTNGASLTFANENVSFLTVDTLGNAAFSRSASGNANYVTILNTSSSTTDNHAVLYLTTTGAGGGSPVVTFNNAGNFVWSAGVDNADSDSFKIGENWTTPYLKIAAGTGATTLSGSLTVSSGATTITSTTGAITLSEVWDFANPTYPGIVLSAIHNMEIKVLNSSHSAGNGNMKFMLGVNGDSYGKFVWTSYGTELVTLQRVAGIADMRVAGAINVTHATQPTINLLQTGQVADTDGMAILTASNNAYIWNRENGNLYLGTNNATKVTIDGNGSTFVVSSNTAPLTATGTDSSSNGVNITVDNASVTAGVRGAGVVFKLGGVYYGGISANDIVASSYGLSSTGVLITPGTTRTSDSVMIRTGSANLTGTGSGSTFEVAADQTTICRGNIEMKRPTTQGYVSAFNTAGTSATRMWFDSNIAGVISTTASYLSLRTGNGVVEIFNGTADGKLQIWDTSGGKYLQGTHDGTDGIWSTTHGNLKLTPTGGTVAVTGAITASGGIASTSDSVGVSFGSVGYWTIKRNIGTGHLEITGTQNPGVYGIVVNGPLLTTSGNLSLVPNGGAGTVAVTGSISASGNVYCPNGSNYIRINTTSDNLEFFRSGIAQGYVKATPRPQP
jgi:hypothetical protein